MQQNQNSNSPSRQPNSNQRIPGKLKIDDNVVQKITGLAAIQTDGVLSMSGGPMEGLKEALGRKSLRKGISTEVGEKQAAIDLNIIIEYDKSIPEVYRNVTNNVTTAIEKMTGLEVVELNLYVDDIDTADDSKLGDRKENKEETSTTTPRVQ
ncbi:Asp23/Gls24 family envelope stress response protein [Sinobaca sp. H24]|uniref:Asp23/Gls24 family envelope stress response protein n=1 Tax=Sinobaca sp. H24 TaxID=2923376 RepID=UPI00207B0ACB|nr:Asp23/Gls24 family envelope stress response protein [Sinobaca sp. H24]